MKKRILSLLTGAAVLAGLCGCAPSEKEEEIVLKVFAQTSEHTGLQEGWFAEVIEDKFCVKLQFVSATEQNLMVQLSAEDLGDIIILNGATAFRDAKNTGLLQDWNEFGMLDTYAADMYASYPEAFEKVSAMIGEDTVYGVASGIADTDEMVLEYRHSGVLNWDYYAKAGYPAIETLEDYAEALQSMKEIAVSEGRENIYGVSLFSTWDDELLYFVSSVAQMYGYEQMGTGYYDSRTGEWQDCLDRDGIYIRVLRFYNELYRTGLLDPASMTQDYDRASDKYSNGQVLFASDSILGSLSAEPMYSFLPGDAEPLVQESNPYGEDTFWAIGAKSRYPEKCMEIIAYLFSTEGKLVTDYGPKGVTWDYDTQGKPYLTEFGRECMSNTEAEMPEPYTGAYLEGSSRFTCTTITDYSNLPGFTDVTYESETWGQEDGSIIPGTGYVEHDMADKETGALIQDHIEHQRDFTNKQVISKASVFVPEYMSADVALARNQVVNAISSYSWNAIYAQSEEEFDTVIEDMIQGVQEYPYDRCITYYKEQARLRSQME